MRKEDEFSKFKHVWTTNELTIGFDFWLSFGWDMNVWSQISVLKVVQSEQKWLIYVSEEPDMMNPILDNERSLKQIFVLY